MHPIAVEAGNNDGLASIIIVGVVGAARSLAMAADCPISRFIQICPFSLEAASLAIKTEYPRYIVFVVDVAGASQDCGVHHLVDFVVVGAAQEDKVAPLLSPPSSSSEVREDGVDGVPPNAVYRRRRGRQGAGDDGKLCPTLHQSPPWSCLRLRRGRR